MWPMPIKLERLTDWKLGLLCEPRDITCDVINILDISQELQNSTEDLFYQDINVCKFAAPLRP